MGEAMRRNALGLPPRGQQNMTMNVPLNQLKDRICPCGEKVFVKAFTLKELPALQSPSGIPETAMSQIGFACVTCGLVIPLRPEEPKEEKPKIELIGG
ncbi:MAG TPA: hypothetical protein PK090_09795 [Smithellaceae bacterium]|jgi:hypothetical protein|nr:hypothetical protein [Smithellaceae bacterium]